MDPVVGEGKTPEERERNKKLRQAISIAMDWEEYIQIFEKGLASPAHGPCRRDFSDIERTARGL